MGRTEKQILQLLNDGKALTLKEIAQKLAKTPKAVFRSLRKLFEKGQIICDPATKRYTLATEE